MMRRWDSREEILTIMQAYQEASVLAAGAELGLFDALADREKTAQELAENLRTQPRATATMADALTAMGLLIKRDGAYELAPGAAELLTRSGRKTTSAMLRHQAFCIRSWSRLAEVVRSGEPADSGSGSEADLEAFIEAMDEICRPMAPELVRALGPPEFNCLLDVGGGPGTWTIAFLKPMHEATALLFDRPQVIPIARRHIEAAGLQDRVSFVAGDYLKDDRLPGGADLAWVSAILHQHSCRENRELLGKVYQALLEGGQVLIRDVIMEETRTSPYEGAMFALNMLVNTQRGGTYTFNEIREDLEAAGFAGPHLLWQGAFMDSVIQAQRRED